MSSTAKQLNVASIQEIDKGKVALAINHAIRQCVLDIEDRPGDKSKRKVKLAIDLTPQLDTEGGALDTVGVTFTVNTSIPVRKTTTYPMLPARDGKVLFQPQSPNDPRQEALFGKPESETIDPVTGEVKKK